MKTPPPIQRLKRLRSRQKTSAWTKNYVPGTHATRKEAPSISQATIIRNTKKFGRDLHALSATERAALLVALWLPSVLDVHEQKILRPYLSPHPLTNFPPARGMQLPELKGMISAFERLEAIEDYPELTTTTDDKGKRICVPDLFEGDVLLYLKDDAGPYCVNWTIKRNAEQFRIANPGDTEFLQSKKAAEKARIRHAAEELYYLDAGIPTYQVTTANFDKNIIRNLRSAYARQLQLNQKLESHMPTAEILIRSTFGAGDTPLELGKYYCRKKRLNFDDWKVILYSILWQKKINFDLRKPFLIDFPVKISLEDNASSFVKITSRLGS